MRSTDGQYYAGLDHLRALAAFLVVVWHFSHHGAGGPVPYAGAPEIGLIDSGHCGVSLFMVLSGYLFAKLIKDRRVDYRLFLYNRMVRLLPLLVVAMLAGLLLAQQRAEYLLTIAKGLILPIMPHGGWSIVVEAHFYVILPLLLWGARKSVFVPLTIVGMAIGLRALLLANGVDLQNVAYFTLIGRIDQFALGIVMYQRPVSGRAAAILFAGLCLFYSWFDAAGGFSGGPPPSVWIILPTIEALGFGALVSWYDRHPFKGRWLGPIERCGKYSYSIYLLQFLLVGRAADFVDGHVMALDNLYIAMPWAIAFFAYMTALGRVSYTYIEEPFLRLRRPYFKATSPPASVAAGEGQGGPSITPQPQSI